MIDLSLDLSDAYEELNQTLKTDDKKLLTLGHVGTHIDIMHTDGLPLTHFITTAHLVDVSNIFDREITLEDTQLESTQLAVGDSVIFRTNWLAKHDYGNKIYFGDHPHLAHTLIDYLLEHKIAIIGLDAPGIRRYQEHPPIDRYCAKKNTFILENIDQLQQLSSDKPFTLYCFPAKLPKISGNTCRVLADQ